MALSFDVDNETAPFCQNTTSLGYIAQAHYGARVGLPRIMSLLKEHRARASFFVPAVSMLLTPEAIEAVQAEGHEIGLHGWIHERCGDLAEGEESELAERSAAVLRRYTGLAPRGMRTPWWDVSGRTVPIARHLGLMYDTSSTAPAPTADSSSSHCTLMSSAAGRAHSFCENCSRTSTAGRGSGSPHTKRWHDIPEAGSGSRPPSRATSSEADRPPEGALRILVP
ncbi:polysaccharide deacetylase family protein [Streptomyces sp. NPDC058603]|uniref:polysaccharide deacetylase family protein n=1 Tax=unclassified Streptomyces TaxID=2593676 RepID=UPI003667DD3B